MDFFFFSWCGTL